jgi:hypothetical protein
VVRSSHQLSAEFNTGKLYLFSVQLYLLKGNYGFMLIYICLMAGIYIVIGLYGIVFIFSGLKAIVRREIVVRYSKIRFSWREIITFTEQSTTVTNSQAVTWGAGQVISGLLACVPWLIPMTWDMPLTWWFFVTPFAGLCLHTVISQISGRVANA